MLNNSPTRKKDRKSFEEASSNRKKNDEDTLEFPTEVRPQLRKSNSKMLGTGNFLKNGNEEQTQLRGFGFEPNSKPITKSSCSTNNGNLMLQSTVIPEIKAPDSIIQKHESETYALIENCKFLTQQFKKSTHSQLEVDLENLDWQLTGVVHEYASQLKLIQDRYTTIEEKLSNTVQKLTMTETELNQAKLRLITASEKLTQAERREINFNYTIENKTKELDALSNIVHELEITQKDLINQLQKKTNSYESIKNTVAQISLDSTIKLLTSQSDNCLREIDSLTVALDKKNLEQKILVEKSDSLTEQLSQVERKLTATTKKLSQAEKRELVLKSSIETKNKELQAVSNKACSLENAENNLTRLLQLKQDVIEKLTMSVQIAHKEKRVVEQKARENKDRDVSALQNKIEMLNGKLNNSLLEVDRLNTHISSREISEKAAIETSDFLANYLTQLESELRGTKSKLVRAEEREVEHNQRIEKKEKELAELTYKLNRLDETLKENSNQLRKKTRSIKDLNSMIRKTEKEKVELKRKFDSINVVEEIDHLKEVIERIAKQRDNGLREIDSLNTTLNKKVENEKVIMERIDSLEKNLRNSERKASSANKKLESSKKREEELNRAIELKHEEVSALFRKFVSAESANNRFSEEIEERRLSFTKLSTAVQELKKKILSIERHALKIKDEEISRLNKIIEMHMKQREGRVTEIGKLKMALNQKESNEELLLENNKVLTTDLRETEKNLKEAEGKLIQLENSEISLKRSMESKTSELFALSQKIDALENTQKELAIKMDSNYQTKLRLNFQIIPFSFPKRPSKQRSQGKTEASSRSLPIGFQTKQAKARSQNGSRANFRTTPIRLQSKHG